MCLQTASMIFRYAESFASANALEGYERLILDAMMNDQSLFISTDAVLRLWEISEPLLNDPPPVEQYAKGSWGPDSVKSLIEPFHWHLPDPSTAH
jgi:glucose-6-phosphate 1-dehydrogenase